MATARVLDWVSDGSALKHPGRTSRALGGRNSLVWGTYIPNASNTGHTFSSPTATYTANQSYNDTGAASPAKVIEGVRFSCKVTVQGKNYVFRNCLFDGAVAGATEAMVQLRYASSESNLFEDCTFAAQTPNDLVNSIQGRGFTLRRCNISGSVDGVDPAPVDGGTRVDVEIWQCYIHDLLRFSPTATQADNQTHSDAIQWMGGLGLTLRGNRIEDKIDITKGTGNSAGQNGTAALMINALGGTIQPGELDMQKNWIRGGMVGINSIGVPNAFLSADGSIITGNRIMNDQTAGTNNRWVGYKTAGNVSTQVALDSAISAGTNYAWDGTEANAFAGSVITNWKVNTNA